MLMLVGFIFLVLGLLTGLALILGPLGLWTIDAGIAVYVLFTVLVVVGYLLVAISSRTATLPLVARITGAMLLLLAVGSAVGLVLVNLAVIQATRGTLPLWYVFTVGGLAGAALLTAHGTAEAR